MKNKLKFKIVSAFLCAAFTFAGCVPTNDSSSGSEVEKPTNYDFEYLVSVSNLEGIYEVSPFIYGEFLEHIPGCIYGAIWAEMIADRKFYYTPGLEGYSPWETVGNVTYTTECYSSNGYGACLTGGSAIKQEVEVEKGKEYSGYFYAKGTGSITVKAGEYQQTFSVNGGFKKFTFNFTSDNAGVLEISFACPSGNIVLDSLSLMPADNISGMRKDSLDNMKALKGTIYRWPGGNFVSGYNWENGIGDRDKRPCERNPAWFKDNGNAESDKNKLASDFYGYLEPNDMGTEEFIIMCEYIGAVPYLAVNTGSDTAEHARQYVEYMNGSVSTEYGAKRAQNGHTEPYNVKYWCVGNEMQGDWQIGHVPIGEYVDIHNAVAEAMKSADSSIIISGCGDNVTAWSDMMFTHCSDNLDYIGEHLYAENVNTVDNHQHIRNMVNNLEMRINVHRDLLAKHTSSQNVKIAFDEWAYLWKTQSTLRDAFGIAAGLNLMIQNADVVGMANYSDAIFKIQKTTAPGAMYASATDVVYSPIGYVLRCYAEYMQNYSATMSIRQTDKDTNLNYQATVSKDGKKVTLAVINPSEQVIKLALRNLSATCETHVQIKGSDSFATNDFEQKGVTEEIISNPQELIVQGLSVNLFVLNLGQVAISDLIKIFREGSYESQKNHCNTFSCSSFKHGLICLRKRR